MKMYESYNDAVLPKRRLKSRPGVAYRITANWNSEGTYRSSYQTNGSIPDPIYMEMPPTGLSIDDARSIAEELLKQAEFFTLMEAILKRENS